MTLIDTHTHLTDTVYNEDLDEVIKRARLSHVERIIVCGYDLDSSRAAVALTQRYEGIFATVGIQPHSAERYDREVARALVELGRLDKVIAFGEIGLDFHYDIDRSKQFEAFEYQIALASSLNLPMVVHSREAELETLEVLKSAGTPVCGCVFHCYQGSESTAEKILEMGFYVGVDGPITYKSSEKLRQLVKMCPADRLLLETDCPYLTPVPHRGKRNEPANLPYVAQEVARIKGISLEELSAITSQNARALFGNGL